jgi:hypothetical protein
MLITNLKLTSMDDLMLINQWLNDPNRSFSEGLTLYFKYKVNNKMDKYFLSKKANPDRTAKGLLHQKMIAISMKIRHNPNFVEKKLIHNAIKKTIETKQPTPTAKPKPVISAQKPKVESRVSKESISGPNQVVVPVKKANIETPSKIDVKDLPGNLQRKFERIQDIAPLLGALHAKLRSCKNSTEAKALCDEITSLDNEKRVLWADIDDFNGKSQEEKDKMLSVDFEKIEALQKKLRITRDSLTRKQREIEKHKKSKKHLVPKGLKKIEEYKKIISEIESEIEQLSGDKAKA